MRKLLLRLGLLLGAAGLLGGVGLALGLRRGYVDAFYARFAAPPAGSLVLGTSRAAQGLVPGVLAARLGGRYAGPWLNYAFTLAESPYGPGYLSSIRRKLAPGTRRGLFVLAVDPWSLSLPTNVQHDKVGQNYKARVLNKLGGRIVFPEEKSMVSQLASVSQNPNLDYLAHYLHKPFYQLLLNADTAHVVERLHPDGWLEIALPPPTADTALLRRRTAEKLATYRQLAATSRVARARLTSLLETVRFLQQHGRVLLVRLPTGPAMANLENEYQPGFDQQMRTLASSCGVPYFNYLQLPYPTNDGNHITRAAARQLSERLAAAIAQLPAQPYLGLVDFVGVGRKQRRRHLIEHKVNLFGDGDVRGIEQHRVGGAAQGAFGAGRVDVVALAQVFDDFVQRHVLALGGQLFLAAPGADNHVGRHKNLHFRVGENGGANVAAVHHYPALAAQALLLGHHGVAHLRYHRHLAHGVGNPHLANVVFPNLIVQAQLVAARAAVAPEADVDIFAQGALHARHIVEGNVVFQQEKRDAPVHGSGIEVSVVERSGNCFSSSAFAARGIAINGDDEVFHKRAETAIGPARLRNPLLSAAAGGYQPPRHRTEKTRY